MGSDPGATPPPPPPWAHRSWCAPECDFRPGAVEGTHFGRPWTLPPQENQTNQLELRLFEHVNETETGPVRVLLSVTERRLADDLDPLAEVRGAPEPVAEGGLADITSSAELTPDEAARVFEQLAAFAQAARHVGGGDRGTT